MKKLEEYQVLELSSKRQNEINGGYDFADFVADGSYLAGRAVGAVIMTGVTLLFAAKEAAENFN